MRDTVPAAQQMKTFKNDLCFRLIAQLEDLYPPDGIEARFPAFDVFLMQFQANEPKQIESEVALIREVCDKIFNVREVQNEKGATVTFKPLPGDTGAAIAEWKKIRPDVIKVARNSLKHDYVWNKISELIEHDVLGDPDEEVDVPLDDKVNINSHLAFWIAVLQRYSATGEAQNFKYFVYLLLVIHAHTARLERMFKSLKEMKSKARNRLSKKKERRS